MNETAAPKKKTLKVVEDGAEQVEAATNVAVPFANFLPFIEEVSRLLKEIVDIYQTAVINKGICGVMLDRVAIAESATKKFLKVRENEEFFSAENYVNLQKLVTVVGKIRKFLAEISQVRGLKKHTQAKNIEKTAMDLNKEFDSTIQLLEFAFMVDFSLRDDIDNKKIRADIEDLIENLQAIGGGGGRFDPNKNVSTIMDKSETNIFQSELLPYNDFEEVEVGENVGKKIKKYKRIKNGVNDFVVLKLVADESIKEEAKNNIKNQVTILSKLEECDNIIQFFGLTTIDGNKWFLVTEWAEYGNLREFYNTFGPLDVKAKVLFAIDISRGLSFLNAVEIVHCDIRAENILITDYQTAKIANFSSSKAVTDVTKNHKTTLERVRYCAPENSEKLGTQTKYNTKSEIYSFGILLWEIAEEKVPYANYNDIMAITELVGEKKYREPFSDASPLPKEYQDIAKKAVDHDPNYRPSFTKIFTVLQDLYMKTSSNSIGSSSPIGSEWIKKKMEEEDINYFEYNEFSKPIPIGKGGFGFVHKAETNDKKQVALKGLIDSVIDENVIKNFVKELKLLRMVSYHDNINRFLGITKDNIGYVMVLEYANEGNLREYLEKKFDSLQWENKIQMALDITRGLLCLHSRNIIHRDLHSKNILVNDGKLLIADFGLSKQLTEVTSNSTSNRMGIIEYVEPQCIRNVNYVKDKRSDVYSLGVLLWEITSGRPPFCHMVERDMLGYHISRENLREEPIEGTPLEYQQLYQKCWDGDPEKRPDINQIYKEILSQSNVNDISEQSEDSLVNNDSLDNLNIQSAQSDLCIKTELVL